ncbi:MAG: PEP-CTERM sorting domain-containing protein [Tepidisphaeraceae bacterium]
MQVNFNDLLALAANYNGTAKTWTTGDFTGDEIVNFSDLLILAANYGATATGSFAGDWSLAQSMVPEPTMVAGLGLAGLLMKRRR